MQKSPLYVDLDGTLTKEDSLFLCLLLLVRRHPLTFLFLCAKWLTKGSRANFKEQLFRAIDFDPRLLQYDQRVLHALPRDRPLILATGANHHLATAVAKHLGFFDSVLASDASTNLIGHRKRQAMEGPNLAYLGNDPIDQKVWNDCSEVWVTGPNHFIKRIKRRYNNVTVLERDPPATFATYIRALRPHQWNKNLLVFLPAVLAHTQAWLEAGLAFVALSFIASSGYLLNDLLDYPDDRIHPTKVRRPLASGAITIQKYLWMFALTAVLGMVASWISGIFVWTVFYWVTSIFYSTLLKRFAVVDVFVLAFLYTLRLIIGGVACDVVISDWLFAFSMLFFLSLALVKRYAELFHVLDNRAVNGRGYLKSDMHFVLGAGISTSIASIVILLLYVQQAAAIYSRPRYLLIPVVIVCFWLVRVWLLTSRGEMNQDPVIFALQDRLSYILGLAVIAAGILATGCCV